MRTTIPKKTDAEIAQMPNGALLVRFMELNRRLARDGRQQWLYDRREQAWAQLQLRRAVGVLSPALCGILAHHLQAEGGIRPCACASD